MSKINKNNSNVSTIQDIEKNLWDAAESLRGNLSSEEYMHVVFGILFLKQISDKYDSAIEKMKNDNPDDWKIHIEDLCYLQKYDCSFIVPNQSKWEYVSEYTNSPEIGNKIDEAFRQLESKNPSLINLFNKNYSRESLDKKKLGEVVSIFANVSFNSEEDIFGRIYEYFLGNFAKKQLQKGGEFYTPKCIVSLMVNLINPTESLYDPCCGSGGMFIQARQHMIENKLNPDKLEIYGQEYNDKTWKLARINLLLQGFFNGNIKLGNKSADTFSNDLHKGLKVKSVLANPPFNIKNYDRESHENWEFGIPPTGNANYAWLQIILEHLDFDGKAAVILANGSLTSSQKDEKKIRANILKADYVSAIISLPDKLFYTVGIPACIWIFDKKKINKNKVLFIDAQSMGKLIEGQKKVKEISNESIKKITEIYNDFSNKNEINIPGLAKSVNTKEIEENDFSLLPGSYIALEEEEKRSEEEIKKELKQNIDELLKLMEESDSLEKELVEVIKKLDL